MGRDLTAEDRELEALLGDVHTIAVVGLSSRPGRPSYEVARYLQRHGQLAGAQGAVCAE